MHSYLYNLTENQT